MTNEEAIAALAERVGALEAALSVVKSETESYVSRSEAANSDGVTIAALRARERRDASFPKPVRLGPTRVGYSRREWESWRRSRLEGNATRGDGRFEAIRKRA